MTNYHSRKAKVRTLREMEYEGEVYNLEVEDANSYVAGTIVVHNCQRCHLHIQGKVDFYRDTLTGIHTAWMAKHVQGYNEWAARNGKPLLRLTGIRK